MAPISTKFLFFLIKLSLLIEFNEIIVLISFLNLVTSRERSVPPLKIFEFGYFFNIFLKFKIVFGAKVELLDLETDEKKRYQIVGTDEVDAKQGLISIKSPIARQLLGKKVGDEVLIRVPKGDLEYEVLDIVYG